MDAFEIVTLLIVAAAILSFINYRFLRLPATIGVMILAVALSGGLIILSSVWPAAGDVRRWALEALGRVHFDRLLLHGMLAFLLFAGGLHIKLRELGSLALPIALLALVGTVVSALLLGLGLFELLHLTHLAEVPLTGCLLFGALISPTDPIAVLAIMKRVGAPHRLEVVISGESLFNDGIAVVMFITLLQLSSMPGATPSVGEVLWLLVRQAGGGMLFGLATGLATYLMLRSVDDFEVEILLTLALAMGAYAGAEALNVSAPIAEVTAALVIGNAARSRAMSEQTRTNLDLFWTLVDSILNAVLFLLVGVQALSTSFSGEVWMLGGIGIVLALLARTISVAAVGLLTRPRRESFWSSLMVLTWGGLRGGISLALALSLPSTPYRGTLVSVTYLVVIFAMGVQGLTIGPLIRRLYRKRLADEEWSPANAH